MHGLQLLGLRTLLLSLDLLMFQLGPTQVYDLVGEDGHQGDLENGAPERLVEAGLVGLSAGGSRGLIWEPAHVRRGW